MNGAASPLLQVRDLGIAFRYGDRWSPVVSKVNFEIGRGEVVGLVGESGSGKTVLGLALLGLKKAHNQRTSGSITFQGREIVGAGETDLRALRGAEISMVFQSPMTALNPAFTVGTQLKDVLCAHDRGQGDVQQRAVALMQRVGIPAAAQRMHAYPHELSGGMRQRVLIAMAIASSPKLLIADEPTTALDVTVQAQILQLLRSLVVDIGVSILFITHNLAVVSEICDRIAVLYAGQLQEIGTHDAVLFAPNHPYTKALMSCVPSVEEAPSELAPIAGAPPTDPGALGGCRFAPRCPAAMARCANEEPPLRAIGAGHASACWLNEVSLV